MSRFIDRCYTEKSANLFLESCKDWIDKINEGRDYCSLEFREQQFLIFAGMLSYYGYEYFDEIMETFEETEFFYVEIDYEEFKKENPEFGIEFNDNPIALTRRSIALELLPPRLISDNTIWLFVQNNCSKIDWLEIIAHEINHVVNSIHKSLKVKGFDVITRTGCSFFSNRHNARSGLVFEESVNVLQTAEIMNHILGFLNFNIYDDEIRSIFDKYREFVGGKSEGIGYFESVPYVRPLYKDERFNEMLVRTRMNGNIRELQEYFEYKTYEGAYNDLLCSVDKFYFSSEEKELVDGKNKVMELVKKYNN